MLFDVVQDGGNVVVKTAFFSVRVCDKKARRCSFKRWLDVRVYPKGPESIIQIENDHAGKG